MMLAPASTAATAMEARYVSTEMASLSKQASERIARIVGRMRESSSSGEIWGACGRVDWPPMSRTVKGCF